LFVHRLQLTNFKSYPRVELRFESEIIGFAGPNGAGKTNLLDALHFLCSGKSYFNPLDRQNIHFGTTFFRLSGEIEAGEKKDRVLCIHENGRRKRISVNKVAVARMSDFMGRFPVVVIAPDDVMMINGGSEERRRFLDMSISFSGKDYLEDLSLYKKVLLQRNTLLKESARRGRIDEDLLQAYDRLLIPAAQRIYEKRKDFLLRFMPYFNRFYGHLTGSDEFLEIIYQSALHEKEMATLLNETRPRDEVMQRTTAGVHRDDLQFILNENELRFYGSQGQKKSALIALKLAQFHYLKDVIGRTPLLLLDDIFDRLDEARSRQLVQMVQNRAFGQVFLSDTSAVRLRQIFGEGTLSFDIFEVEDARIAKT